MISSSNRLVQRLLSAISVCLLAACQQAQTIKAFTEADYRLEGIENVKINGLSLEERAGTGRRLSNQERDDLLAAVATNNLTLDATMLLHVSLREPTGDQTLTITNMKWLILVEGQEALTGNMDQAMVLHDGLNRIPVQSPVQLTEVDGRPNYEGLSRVVNLVSSNGDIRQALTFQIKPTVKTPVGNIESPKFISVSKPRE
ncbi:hypothetical protein FVR03_01485 [Pontibacter qinzhouensis]|uniref:DUF4292 domain-containing protein n=1 Tax=Pontibacter qinzhouensis TaxID=2603253 RepID=A0A5C8KCT3_9BACT|nr:hypothetical protein [Pontibacter qinzhouensis]TXK52417.1 hypothetical protein FVR03_01485 [Pontibacter qinzhouensis]